MNSVLSTVASRSVIRQGLSCFCSAIVVGGDDVALFQLFNKLLKLLDGLLEKGWTKGSEVEACRAEYQAFVQEQRQLERSSTRSRPDVGDVLSFCSAQAGFRARRHLYKKCIVSNLPCCFDPYELSCRSYELLLFQVFQLTSLVVRGPATHGDKIIISPRACRHQGRGSAWCPALCLCAGFCSEPALHTEKFLLRVRLALLSESVATADSITSSQVYTPWSVVEPACASQVITDLVVLRRRTGKDIKERWYQGGTPRSETASRPGVRITNVVEEGRVEYVPVTSPALGPPGPSKIRSFPSKRKIKVTRSPVKLPRRFEVSSPPASPPRRSIVEDPSFASALASPASLGKSRRSGRDRRAAPVFQMGFP